MIQRYDHKPIEPIEAVQVPLKTDPDYAERHGEIVAWLINSGVSWSLDKYYTYKGISYQVGNHTKATPGWWLAKRGDRIFPLSPTAMESYYKDPGQTP